MINTVEIKTNIVKMKTKKVINTVKLSQNKTFYNLPVLHKPY